MSDLIAWIREHVRKNHLKEFIMTHTGLTPPAFIAVVALAATGTALTVSAVSSLLAPTKKNNQNFDDILDNKVMPYSNNQRGYDVNPIPTIDEVPKEEEEAEEVEPPAEKVEDPAEKVEDPAKEEVPETTAPTATDGEDNISSGYVEDTST